MSGWKSQIIIIINLIMIIMIIESFLFGAEDQRNERVGLTRIGQT